MSQKSNSANQLSRGLGNRHIQLIALGGAVGTGLFLTSSDAIHSAGPAVLLGFAVTGFIAFLIMRQLSEMTVQEPVAGSFSYFAYRYWSNFAGFVSGWNYWLLYVLVSMAELTAVSEYCGKLWPDLPAWVSIVSCFLLINIINLSAVRFYGEAEFLFSLVKIVAIVGMLVYGSYLLFFGDLGPNSSISNLWKHGGFMPNGWHGLIMSLAIIMFSFGGLELIGITAAEAKDPEVTIPKATNQVIYRILIFYIGTIGILLCLQPWTDITKNVMPFATVFQNLDQNFVYYVMYGVALVAALSVYNSSLYCNSRMLYGLAQQGNAPKSFQYTTKSGIPVVAVCISGVITLIVLVLKKYLPDEALTIVASLVVSTLVLNWILISITHIMFRRAKNKVNEKIKFKALFYPLGNAISLVFLFGILVIMWVGGLSLSVELIPIWIFVLAIGYKSKDFFKK